MSPWKGPFSPAAPGVLFSFPGLLAKVLLLLEPASG